MRVQVYCHDLPTEDCWDRPQCSAAPQGNHSGLPEGPGCFRQAVTFTLFSACKTQMFSKSDTEVMFSCASPGESTKAQSILKSTKFMKSRKHLLQYVSYLYKSTYNIISNSTSK